MNSGAIYWDEENREVQVGRGVVGTQEFNFGPLKLE